MADFAPFPPAGAGGPPPVAAADPIPAQPATVALEDVDMDPSDDEGFAGSPISAPETLSRPFSSTAPLLHLDPLFSAPENDVVLLSADGKRLGFRRVFLETASDVFRDMGLVASPDARMDGTADDVPVIALAEHAEPLAMFLLWLHPRASNPPIEHFYQLNLLCQTADKYDVESVARAALSQHGVHVSSSLPSEILTLAIIHRMPVLAAAVLRSNEAACDVGKPCVIDEMEWNSIRRLHPAVFYRLFLQHEKFPEIWRDTCEDLREDRDWFEVSSAKKAIKDMEKFHNNARKREREQKAAAMASAASATSSTNGAVSSAAPVASTAAQLAPNGAVSIGSTAAPSSGGADAHGRVVGSTAKQPSLVDPVFRDPTTDLKVFPSNGERCLRFPKALLKSQSKLLHKIISTAEKRPSKPGQPTYVQLDLPKRTLYLFLLYTHPQSELELITSLESLEQFCRAGQRYHALSTVQRGLRHSGHHLIEKHPPTVLVLALLFGLPELDALALLEFDHPNNREGPPPQSYGERRPFWEVRDIPWRLGQKLPYAVLIKLIRCEVAIKRGDYRFHRWADVSGEVQMLGAKWVDDAEAWVSCYDPQLMYEPDSDEESNWSADEMEAFDAAQDLLEQAVA